MVSYEHNVVFSFPVETVLRGKEKEMWRLDNYLFSKQLIANTVDAYSGIELNSWKHAMLYKKSHTVVDYLMPF